MQGGVVGPPVVHRDLEQDVLGRRLRVLHLDVEVPAGVEDPGIEKLVFGVRLASCPVDRNQVGVREFGLRVLVEHPQVRRGGRGVEVEIVLLDVFTMITLGVREAEQPLLEDRVAAVPQAQRQAQQLPVVADAGQPVLSPPVSTGTGLIVREGRPGVMPAAVVLTYGPPLPLTDVRPPAPPGNAARVSIVQSLTLSVNHVSG
jgi:hypothetical protein